jgi:hypothetical protein
MLGFKSFVSAQATLVGIELMHMLRKGQMEGDAVEAALRPNNSTPWLCNPPPGREHSSQSVYTQKFATQPLLANSSMEL